MKVYFAKYTLLILLASCATTKKTEKNDEIDKTIQITKHETSVSAGETKITTTENLTTGEIVEDITKRTIIPDAGTIFEEHIHRDIKPSHRDTKQDIISSFDASTAFDETIDAGFKEKRKENLNQTSKPSLPFGCQLGGIGIFIVVALILIFIIRVIVKRLKEKAKNVGL